MFYLMIHSTHFIYVYMEGRNEMFYLMMHSTHLILWLYGVGQIVREETRCHHMGYSF